ncbi:MAG: hypothetical protein COA85_02380 [Robiginitomaculum sp.]|nr:MAG: hypothetical protein COA85_02380 [Robiginitomaculum sp.]
MSKAVNKIWINGQVQEASLPVFMATDRGALLGDGLFETIKVLAGQPCYFDDHWARLCTSAKFLNLPISFERASTLQGLVSLTRCNGLTDGVARLTLSRGMGPRGLDLPVNPDPVMMLTTAHGLPHYDHAPVLGLSQIKRNACSVSSCHKTLSYIDNIAARMQQTSTIKRDEVVILDTDGHIASASAANLFWWDEQVLYTPALGGAIIPGTMRARVLVKAHDLGMEIQEGLYRPAALLTAKGAFMTNALLGMQLLFGLDFGPEGAVRFTTHSSPSFMAFMAPLLSMLGGGANKTSPPA